MLWGIQTFQSRPVELLDPVKKPEEEEEKDDADAEVELDDEVEEVLLENDDENHPEFDVELAPEILEVVVWLF